MENMDKGLTAPKWALINCPKIPENLSAQIVCSCPIVWDFDEKRLHWASVVRGYWDAGCWNPHWTLRSYSLSTVFENANHTFVKSSISYCFNPNTTIWTINDVQKNTPWKASLWAFHLERYLRFQFTTFEQSFQVKCPRGLISCKEP